MASIKPIIIEDMTGGMNTADPTTIKDNEFASLKNMMYDQDKILTTRRGSAAFGEPVPDTVTLINACDAITNFAVADDADTLATGTARRGTFSVSFNINVAASGNDFATLSNSSLGPIDLGAANDYLRFWLFVPTAFNTNLSSVKVRLGSDSSNYYEWTLGTLTENSNNFINLAFSSATTTGTPNQASINYFRLQITYTASYTNKTGVRIDSIYTYSNTSTKQEHSLQFHQSSTGTGYLLVGAGTNLFEYREDEELWEVIKTGLTDGERFSSALFKDVIYITSAVDDYLSYNGTLVSAHAAVPKAKYIKVANDVGYLAGVTADPSYVYYTAANPTNLQSYGNFEPVNEDDGQNITGIEQVGPLIVVFKERSNYIFNSSVPSINQTDYDGGCKGFRTISRVENDTYFLSENGIFSLSQREGTTGAIRGTPISKNIRNNLQGLSSRDYSCGKYWPSTNNYYLAVDDENTGKNRTIYVLSTLTGGWTYWKGINANEFCVWEDSDGIEHLLAANPYGGQTIEMETGFTDQGNDIAYEIITKTYDFGNPGRVLVQERIDVTGFHTANSDTDVVTEVTNISMVSRTKNITYSASRDGTSVTVLGTLASRTLGSTPLGGSGSEGSGDLTLYPFQRYMPLYITGRSTRLGFTGSANASAFALTKLTLWPIALGKDVVPQSLYI